MNKQDQELIGKLQEKLEDYTYFEKEEEFDAEEVSAICDLLEVLNPLEKKKNAEESYLDFQGKYMKKKQKDSSKKIVTILKRALISVAVVCLMLFSLNIGTYATKGESFFQLLSADKDGIEFISGINRELPNRIQYDSWEELNEEFNGEIVEIKGLPDGYSLKEITAIKGSIKDVIDVSYEKEKENIDITIDLYKEFQLRNKVNIFEETMKQEKKEEVTIYEVKGEKVILVEKDKINIAYFFLGKGVYIVMGEVNIEELRQIAELTIEKENNL